MAKAQLERLELMLVTDGRERKDLARVVEAALRGGVRCVQLRESKAGARALFDMAVALRGLTREHDAWLIVNDRLDVALAAGADGAQLGWRSLPIGAARAIADGRGDAGAHGRFVIGVSTHSVRDAVRADQEGADFVVFGPIYDTPSKRGLIEPQGVARLAECARAVSAPVIAIGGVTPSRAAELARAGAAGMAAIRGLMESRDPAEAAREYRRHWQRRSGD